MILGFCSDEFRDRVWPSLDEGARSRLETYTSDLLRYNRAQNLVSRRDPELRVAALLEECVRAGQLLKLRGYAGGAWADVGSGGGIPGLVLGALDPTQRIVLIERRQGRCDFLRRQTRAMNLPSIDVFEGDAAVVENPDFDLVLAKAVAPPGEIEEICGPLLAPHGVLVVFGRRPDAAAGGWGQVWTEELPGEDSVLRGLVRD